MNVEVSILIALVGCFVGLGGWLAGRDKKIAGDAEWKGEIKSDVKTIKGNTSNIMSDIKDIKDTLTDHGERISKLEAKK